MQGINITKMSSRGQVVIPLEMRKDLKEGVKLVVMRNKGKIIATNEDFTKTNHTTISNGTGHWVIESVVNATYTITGYSTNVSIDGDVEAHVVV